MTPTTRPGRALVTGASAGIGRAFAVSLAAAGYTVTAVARSAKDLAALRDEIGEQHDFLVADLATTEGLRVVTERLSGSNYALLVNNAGTAVHGDFAETSLAAALGTVDLNCRTVMTLAHAFLGRAEAGSTLVNVASTLAYTPKPGAGVYSATKAFVTVFSETLWHEQRARGVHVMALCPGVTLTRSQLADDVPSWLVQTPQRVADRALAAVAERKGPIVYTGRRNRLFATVISVLPARIRLAILAD